MGSMRRLPAPTDHPKETFVDEQSEKGTTSNPPSTPAADSRRRFRRRALFGLFAGVAGALGFAAWSRAHGGHGWRCGAAHRALDAEEAADRLGCMAERMLSHVNASDEQKAKVADVTKAALKELWPLREQHRAARTRAVELLAQPSIDREALEQLRATQVQLADAASRRVTQALADAAEVLTPEQRSQLAERWKWRMG